MLVLSRRPDTAIQIGRDIKVRVLSIRNRQVKLGIDAPSGVRVWRDELCRGDPSLLEDDNENRNADEQAEVEKTRACGLKPR
jgi:carbon storage regulator CsrA